MKLKSFTGLPFTTTKSSPDSAPTTTTKTTPMPSKYLSSNPSSDSDISDISSSSVASSSSSSSSLDSRVTTSYLSLDDDKTIQPLRLLSTPLPSLTAPSSPSSSVTALAFSSASSILFYATAANTLSLYDTTTSSLIEELNFSKSAGPVKSITFIGPKLVTAHQDGKIRVWKPNRATGSFHHDPIATLPTVSDRIRHFAFPGNYVQMRRHGRRRLWIEHHDAVSCLAVNESLGLIYSVSWDKRMNIWSANDLRCLESVDAHSDAVNAVVVSRSGVVFTGSADKTIRVWQRKKERNRYRHALVATMKKHGSGVNALALGENDEVLFSGSGDRSIVEWERTSGGDYMEPTGVLRGHDGAVLCLIYGGDLLFSGAADRTVRIWRRGSEGRLECLCVLEGHRRPVKALAARWEGEGDRVVSVVSGGLDGEIRVWRVNVLNNNVDYKCD